VVNRLQALTLETEVRDRLTHVMDPEIPTCSIQDLGLVERIEVTDDAIEVDLLPTFAGCPALDVIERDVRAAVEELAEGRETRVKFVYDPPWTTDRISAAGERYLRAYGISPAPHGSGPGGPVVISIADVRSRVVLCPYCGSEDTNVESAFGPTPCRTTHFCRSCRNPFEGFKPKTR
jgi:ring-1,2-phenylacetyl-CoA epoxidase subunit PaaD